MALTDLAAYKSKLLTPAQSFRLTKNSLTTVAGRPSSVFATAPFAGAAPTTAVVPTNSAANGYFGQLNAGSPQLRIGRSVLSCANLGVWLLCDRLSHQGGLSGIVATSQTTNLATAALTRYTSGEGVWAALEIYTQIGTTASNFTCTYVDQAGGTSTSLAQLIGATNFREVGRLIPILLATGDYGVRSVSEVTIGGGSTGTAGNIGVTLFKPLLAFPMNVVNTAFAFDPLASLGGQMPEVFDDACLFWVAIMPNTSSSGILQADIGMFED